jgi:hypothetical protein
LRQGRQGGEDFLTTDLIEAARNGDGEAFRELIGPYERELRVHCYRMLGSLTDAEDVMQEALLTAWQGLAGFQGRASVRTRFLTVLAFRDGRTYRLLPTRANGDRHRQPVPAAEMTAASG